MPKAHPLRPKALISHYRIRSDIFPFSTGEVVAKVFASEFCVTEDFLDNFGIVFLDVVYFARIVREIIQCLPDRAIGLERTGNTIHPWCALSIRLRFMIEHKFPVPVPD